MSRQTRYLMFLAVNLSVLSSSCAAWSSEPAVSASASVPCRGGTLQSEADAAAYVGCTSVTGDLRIRHSSLTTLDALSSLRQVSGTLEISGNAELEDLRGLENLRQVRHVRVENNGIYESVGLGDLREVETLVVKDNRRLISLRGFKGLQRARSIEISGNPRLAAYYGLLPELKQVEHRFELRGNVGLSKREVVEVRERVARGSVQPRLVAKR